MSESNQRLDVKNPKPKTQNPKPLLPFFTFLFLLFVSWRRWTAPIADSGREMDLPLRLLRGEWLYRDVHFLYPPLAPYLNAFLYWLCGARLAVLWAAGVVCAALLALLCYHIARRVLDPLEASLATTGIVALCLFKPAGNLISPYSFAALYGVLCSLGVLWLMVKQPLSVSHPPSALRDGGQQLPIINHQSLIGVGALIGLAAITKQEFALAGALTVVAALVWRHRRVSRRWLIDVLWAAGAALLLAAPVYGVMLWRVGWRVIVFDCHLLYTNLPAPLVFYNAHRTGLARPLWSLVQMLGGAAVCVVVAAGISLWVSRAMRRSAGAWAVLGVSLAAVLFVRWLVGAEWDGSPLRALPLLLVAVMVSAWRQRSSGALFVIAAYSLAVLLRVVLRVPSGGAFGGYFLPTSFIVIVYLLARALPEWLAANEAALTAERTAQRARAISLCVLLLLFLISAVVFGVRYRRNFDYELRAERGRLFVPRASGQVINEAFAFLRAHTQPGETIAVLPEGSDLAFLTGRRIDLRHQILIPGLMKDEGEAIRSLARDRVRYVFVVNRPMREFGAEAFGRDFYGELGGWIEANYRLVEVFGAPGESAIQIGDPRFFIKVYERVQTEN